MTKRSQSGIMKHMAEKEIDPRFFLPPNVVDLNYNDEVETSQESSDLDNGVDLVVTSEDYFTDLSDEMEGAFSPGGTDEDRLLPPDYIELVSQTARVSSGGTVVDVIIDVEDIANVSQFDVRLTV